MTPEPPCTDTFHKTLLLPPSSGSQDAIPFYIQGGAKVIFTRSNVLNHQVYHDFWATLYRYISQDFATACIFREPSSLSLGLLGYLRRSITASHPARLENPFLIIVQQDATYSVYYISVGSSTCFGCRHPSSGARTTVITASGID